MLNHSLSWSNFVHTRIQCQTPAASTDTANCHEFVLDGTNKQSAMTERTHAKQKLTLHVDNTYNVSGTDIYPHMPILRPHAARFHERRISSVTLKSAHLYGDVTREWAWPARSPIRPILGFWESKVPQNWIFPALDADEPPNKM